MGGGGLCSTAGDYLRFAEMLRGRGELDGVRILAPSTVAMMASNHLPGGVDLSAIGRPLFAETTFDGVGFGLGVSVTIDPVKAKVPGNVGDYGWGGAASTNYWVDPVDDLTVVFLTQLLPSSTHPIRSQLKQLVHARGPCAGASRTARPEGRGRAATPCTHRARPGPRAAACWRSGSSRRSMMWSTRP